MFNRRITAGLLSGVVAVGLVLSAQTVAAFTAQDAAKLEAEAKATLAKFQADTKGAEEVFANAKGILVCPKITKGGFIIGIESGDCVLTKGAPKPIYYGTSALKGGLLVGIAWYSMILVLNTDDAVAKFTKGEREWEMGVDASVAVATGGRWRRSRYDQSEERHRVLHLRRQGLDGGCVLLGLAFQEARGRVTPGATSHPGPGAMPGCSDTCVVVSAPRSSWAGSSRGAVAHPDKSGGN